MDNEIKEMSKELLISMAKGLVKDKDSVKVTFDEQNEEGVVVFHLIVSDEDKGRVIGKEGRIAKAIRVIMRAAANMMGYRVMVEISWLLNIFNLLKD